MSAFVDLTGRAFGRWTVQRRAPTRLTTGGRFALTYWECRCVCGTVKDVRAQALYRGKSTSCGCWRQEKVYDALRTHGETVRSRRNRPTPEYTCWQNMLNRCRRPNDPGYKHYGGRGIRVAPEWSSFERFLEDMGRRPSPKHSLDRIDVNSGYSKSNCRWVTAEIQVANRRKIAVLERFTTDELVAELAKRGISVGGGEEIRARRPNAVCPYLGRMARGGPAYPRRSA